MLTSAEGSFPRLAAKASGIGRFRELLRELEGKLLPDGSVADTASVALGRIRRDIEHQRKRIEASLDRFLRQHSDDDTLQEEYVTLRNDRFVVPVVASFKGKVPGVVHGSSSTGRTLFIEPMETIELNNELVKLRDDEVREVHRILAELTGKLRLQAHEIHSTMTAMGELEFVFAKADFAMAFHGTVPEFCAPDERQLTLRNARHPLLIDILRRHGREVVPVSLELDETTNVLLISGPNTGGKTVTMKTVGLLALMAHAGLPVPAEAATFPLFDQVLADIGDHQSLSESLSSFSAHMARVQEIEAAATFESLVLLDELGRATDPEEGGALGVALLDQFRMIGAMTVASTHLLAMKVFGANTQGVLNGSMGFDDATLEPTYVLRLGAPGKSAALDIAARLGLPERILERARGNLTTNERDIARFLAELHAKLETNEQLERDLRIRQRELEVRQAQLDREFQKRDAARVREMEKQAEVRLARFETEARKTIQKIMEAADARKFTDRASAEVARVKREFRDETTRELKPTTAAATTTRLELAENMRVRLKGVREVARVRKLIGLDRLEVEAGLLRMQVDRDDVTEILPPAETPSKLPKNVSVQTAGPKWDISYRELNLLGRRAEEAVDELDKFLDNASLASVDRVRVVHGFGMGVLRRAVAEHLARHVHVERYYPAPANEGGAGATIVELKAG